MRYPVDVMARVFEVSRSGFHGWLKGYPSVRAKEDERLKVAIRANRTSSRETYGVRRLQPEPAAEITFSTRDRSDRRSGGPHRAGWAISR